MSERQARINATAAWLKKAKPKFDYARDLDGNRCGDVKFCMLSKREWDDIRELAAAYRLSVLIDKTRNHVTIETLQGLVAALSDGLTDEGPDWSTNGLHNMRVRVANALPPGQCPDWLQQYRDPKLFQS